MRPRAGARDPGMASPSAYSVPASGLPALPLSLFSLGHGDAARVQCVFKRAGRGPGQRGQRSSGKSRFVWNSEVGKRGVGISAFWYQAICMNRVVRDAVEVTEFARKHTGKVGEALGDIRRIVEGLVSRRDERRDGFAAVIKKAMETRLGEDAEEVMKVLTEHGISKGLGKRALD